MKRRFFSIFACVLIAACAVIDQFTSDLDFTLSREGTVFSPKNVWGSGDAVNVLSSTRTRGKVFSLSSGTRSEKGRFAGEKPGSAPFHLVWPATFPAEYSTPAFISASIQSVQTYAKDAFDASACLYVASAESSAELQMRTPMAVLELPLTGDMGIARIELKTPEGYPLCGTAQVRVNDVPSLSFDDESGNTLTLDCGKGVKPGSRATVFRLVIPPAALAAGASLLVTDIDGGAMRLALDPVTLERGDLLTLPQTAYVQAEPPYLNLKTPGLYTLNAKGQASPVYAYEALRDQMALVETADAIQWRLQCLEDGKVLSVQVPPLRDAAFEAQFSAIGVPACPEGVRTLSNVKRADGLEWCVDADAKLLLILRTAL